jgi:hypothetical protein
MIFPAYLENSSDPAEKENIRRHLAECGSCREALGELEWIGGLLRSMPDGEPPETLLPSVMAACSAEGPPLLTSPPVYTPFPRGRLGILALIVLIVGLFWYLSPSGEKVAEQNGQRPGAAAVPPAAGSGDTGQQAPAPAPPLSGGTFQVTERAGKAPVPAAQPMVVPQPSLPVVPSLPAADAVRPQRQQATPARSQPAPAAAARGKMEAAPELPSDWDDTSSAARAGTRRLPAAKRTGGELAVLLDAEDQDRAEQEIERAVAAAGGVVTGRAHGSGRDIIYTRIDAGSLMDLLGRLRTVGTLRELPQLPDDSQGRMDLVIRW